MARECRAKSRTGSIYNSCIITNYFNQDVSRNKINVLISRLCETHHNVWLSNQDMKGIKRLLQKLKDYTLYSLWNMLILLCLNWTWTSYRNQWILICVFTIHPERHKKLSLVKCLLTLTMNFLKSHGYQRF